MNHKFTLTQWQKKQAALLYYFSSMEYLIGLRDRVNQRKIFRRKQAGSEPGRRPGSVSSKRTMGDSRYHGKLVK